jgi:hypothetical protein
MAYVEYTGSIVRQCLEATTEIYQDGYIHCPIIDTIGCIECEKRFGDGSGWEYDESQNYEREPRWRKNEEVEKVPKKTYWTKCGRKFEKNSTAAVTGYTIDESDKECADCPFWVEVTDGWGENKRHIRWECRAGSKPPNQVNDWVGSTEDKLTIQIRSLHKDFLESIFEYCESQPDLSAGYNQDEDDCRRVISVSCSQNKKGMAAKKALIEKFFPEIEAAPDERYEEEDSESLFDEQKCRVCGCTNDHACEDGCCWVEPDLCSRCAEMEGNMPEICRQCENEGTGCVPNSPEKGQCAAYVKKGENEEMIYPEQKCKYKNTECGYYCVHNEGCALVLAKGDALKTWMQHVGEVDCDVWKEVSGTVQTQEKTPAEDIALEASVSNNVQSFDYSTLDAETAAFLQEKANRITEIRIKSVIALGKEFKEARDRLSSHNKYEGVFGKWTESLNISRQTAQNYIQAYEYVVKNFDNIEAAENIQPSLLFAASKPSAPKELSDKVASGDITTHKQYKELEEKLKVISNHRDVALRERDKAFQEKIAAEQHARELDRQLKEKDRQLGEFSQQLDQAKRNGDPAKVQELGKKIAKYQAEVESLREDRKTLNQEINNLRKQLKEKPIETQPVKVVEEKVVEKEVIPDEVALAIYDKVSSLYEGLAKLTDKEIKVFADQVDPDYYNDIINTLDNAMTVLDRIETATYKATTRPKPEAPEAPQNNSPIRITDDPACACGSCAKADMDYNADELENNNRTWCTVYERYVDISEETCDQFEFYGGELP